MVQSQKLVREKTSEALAPNALTTRCEGAAQLDRAASDFWPVTNRGFGRGASVNLHQFGSFGLNGVGPKWV
jgi:hypothetical protein